MALILPRVESKAEDGRRSVKSFVLRRSRLAPYQKEALELYSDKYVIPFGPEVLDFEQVFGNTNPVIIEIGFGMGHSTQRIASQMPLTNFLAIEVFINGFTKLLSNVGRNEIQNIRLIRFDAVEVLQTMISQSSVVGFHIFFPDPWPKKKHHKRRLIQKEFAQLLAEKLVAGGYIYCVTDWQEYADQMLEVFATIPTLYNPHNGFSPPHSWRPTTNFEEKGLHKRHIINEIWVEKSRE
ncbi:MAG: tRNA (guanosine(46)-N7)-methyltransferase TrmB [Sphaerochaetaceae bacterium]